MKRMLMNGLRLLEKCKRDNIGACAAQTAFFLMMSIVPLFMFFITLIQYTPISKAMLLTWVHKYLPAYTEPVIITILDEVYSKSTGILSTTAVIAIWSAAKGIHYLSNGLDEVHEVQEKPNWFLMRIRAVFYTFVFMLAIILFMVILVFGHSLEEPLMQYVPIVGNILSAVLDFRLLIITPIMLITVIMAFQFLPDHKSRSGHGYSIKFHNQLPGAALCTTAWYLFSLGVSIYVGVFNGFSMYGSLATIVLMMFWIYFCIYILLFCAEINQFYYDDIEFYWRKLHNKKE